MPDDTAPKQVPGAFVKGQSGNPAGRPKGARSRLGDSFLTAIAADFEEHGVKTIIALRSADPAAYCKIIAGLMPKELEIKRPMADLSDDELANAIELIRTAIASDPGSVPSGVTAAASGKPAGKLPALH
jgi:hypothetical protein